MLVAALAAGELREKMQLDVQPLLTVQDSTATLELLAVKLSSKEISAAIKQLSVAAKVMVYALHAANLELAAACKLEVVGRVGVAAKLPTELRAFWEKHRVDVGCAAVPTAAGTFMVVSAS